MSLFKAFRERVTAFGQDTRGSMATMFALAFGTMISFAGAAVDLSRSVQAHALLQQATDSAALAAVSLARAEGADLTSASSFETTVVKFMEANLEIALTNNAPVRMFPEYTIAVADGSLTVTAQAPLPSGFTRLIGMQTLDIAARTVVEIPPDTAPAATLPFISG